MSEQLEPWTERIRLKPGDVVASVYPWSGRGLDNYGAAVLVRDPAGQLREEIILHRYMGTRSAARFPAAADAHFHFESAITDEHVEPEPADPQPRDQEPQQ